MTIRGPDGAGAGGGPPDQRSRFHRGAIFGLPEYHQPFSQFIRTAIRAVSHARDPLYARIGAQRTHIAYPRTRISLRSGEVLDSQGVRVGMTMDFQAAEIVGGNMDSVYEAIDSAAAQNVKQVMSYLFTQLSSVSEAVGTAVDAGGQPFTWDLVNEMLGRMDIAFDHDGRPVIPTLVVNPAMAATMPPMTKDQERERDEIIERKRQEFLAQRRTRRIPRDAH